MREKWEDLQAMLEKMKTMKIREYFLTLAVCALSGLVLGLLISPRKRVMIGSNNGNNNVGGLPIAEEEECSQEEKKGSR